MTEPAIQLDGLTRRYGDTTALDAVDLSIPSGTLFCLLGRNGAGKTTALDTVAGLARPTRGDVRISGVSARSSAIRGVRRRMGYMVQSPALYHHLTGREFLRFVGELYEVAPRDLARLDERLASLEMTEAADTAIRTYSAGMKKKIAFLASILYEPEYLLLDEPFASLDAVAARIVKEEMVRFRDARRVVLFATHTMEIAERFAERLAILDRGRLRFEGTLQELRSRHGIRPDEALEALFLRLTAADGAGCPSSGGP